MNIDIRVVKTRAEWDQILALRIAVFVDEQSGPADEEPDGYDPVARHLMACRGDRVVGCARLIDMGDGHAKIGRVAVAQDVRGTGVGERLMRAALRTLQTEGVRSVALDAQVPVIGFYERFGFTAVGGEFLDGGIPHRKMVLGELPGQLSTAASSESPSHFRNLFPHTRTGIHLNHAGLAPVALPVAYAADAASRALLSDDTLKAYMDHADREKRLRKLVGRMVNAASDTIGFVRNTSHGLAIAAAALPERRGGNTVCVSNDYPSQVYPWMARGDVKLVSPREDGRVYESDLEAACDDSTDVMAVSWVHWTSGQELDLHRLGSFCRSRGITFVVDVVQGLGALRLDLGALPVDIASAGCHKWMMAPAGIGMLYVRPEIMQTLAAVNIGWNSVERPMDWDRLHFEDLRATPRRFEEGSPSLPNTAALLASLEVFETFGFDRVDQRVRALADHTRTCLRARGMNISNASTTSGIVPFLHPTLSSDHVAAVLDQEHIRCAVRGGWIRFSPHFYMDEAEIEEAVAKIPVG